MNSLLPIFGTALLAGFVAAQIATFATTVYLHRTLSHRALALHPAVAFGFRAVVWLTTGIKPRQWVAVHRKHHAFTDEPEDPHSPAQLGWVRVQLTNASLYRRVANDPATVARYARDLPADRWDRMLFDRGFLGLGIALTLLVVMLGPVAALLAAVLHTIIYLALNAAVNAITHTFGSRPHENTATNLGWLALLTAGEGLHNNHHAVPTSAKFSMQSGEIDLAWLAVSLMAKLKLATIRHDEAKVRELVTTR